MVLTDYSKSKAENFTYKYKSGEVKKRKVKKKTQALSFHGLNRGEMIRIRNKNKNVLTKQIL